MFKKYFLPLFLASSLLSATEYAPWFGRNFEIEARLKGTYANYPSIFGKHDTCFHHSDDFFIDGSLSSTYYDLYNGEVELGLSDTQLHEFEGHYLSLTGRRLWMNDNINDPVSITTGLTLRKVWKHCVPDFLPQHHGRFEGEIHVAVGKQFICEDDWNSRVWGMVGLGFGSDGGAPWIRSEVDYEQKFLEYFLFTGFCKGYFGLGSKSVCEFNDKWAPIKHQAVDLGLKLSFLADDYSILSFEYAHRIFSKNAPRDVDYFQICYMYPFGL